MSRSSRPEMRFLLALCAALVLILATTVAVQAGEAPSKTQTVVLEVDGMSCGGCAAGLQQALSKIPGVTEAKVSFDDKQARVVYDPALTKPEAFIARIEKEGYKARVKTG